MTQFDFILNAQEGKQEKLVIQFAIAAKQELPRDDSKDWVRIQIGFVC